MTSSEKKNRNERQYADNMLNDTFREEDVKQQYTAYLESADRFFLGNINKKKLQMHSERALK